MVIRPGSELDVPYSTGKKNPTSNILKDRYYQSADTLSSLFPSLVFIYYSDFLDVAEQTLIKYYTYI